MNHPVADPVDPYGHDATFEGVLPTVTCIVVGSLLALHVLVMAVVFLVLRSRDSGAPSSSAKRELRP